MHGSSVPCNRRMSCLPDLCRSVTVSPARPGAHPGARARGAQELSQWHFKNKLLITGTPLQNSMRELWALLHFLEPAKFPDIDAFDARHSLQRAEDVRPRRFPPRPWATPPRRRHDAHACAPACACRSPGPCCRALGASAATRACPTPDTRLPGKGLQEARKPR